AGLAARAGDFRPRGAVADLLRVRGTQGQPLGADRLATPRPGHRYRDDRQAGRMLHGSAAGGSLVLGGYGYRLRNERPRCHGAYRGAHRSLAWDTDIRDVFHDRAARRGDLLPGAASATHGYP